MEINRTSIDVDAAALRGIETRLIYASFVQYQYKLEPRVGEVDDGRGLPRRGARCVGGVRRPRVELRSAKNGCDSTR